MRILLTADPFIPVPPRLYGGIERIIDSLGRGLERSGVQVALLAHPDSLCSTTARFSWPRTDPRSTMDHLACAATLRRCVKKFKPDLVHSFSRLAYLTSILPLGLPKVMSYQRDPALRTVRLAHWLARGSLRFTGCSDYIAKLGRASAGEWEAIPNFVELDRFRFTTAVDSDAPLVFLSRIESIKGTDTAIAVARASGRRLVIAGNAPDKGAELEWYQREILPQVDGQRVSYIGPVDDVQKSALLSEASALLVPIRWNEPFGIVFAEALACGTPIISCPMGALPEIVEHGVNGFLVNSIAEGVAAVGRIGDIDRQQCRKSAEQKFSAGAVIAMYRDLYLRMISARDKP